MKVGTRHLFSYLCYLRTLWSGSRSNKPCSKTTTSSSDNVHTDLPCFHWSSLKITKDLYLSSYFCNKMDFRMILFLFSTVYDRSWNAAAACFCTYTRHFRVVRRVYKCASQASNDWTSMFICWLYYAFIFFMTIFKENKTEKVFSPIVCVINVKMTNIRPNCRLPDILCH